MTCSSKTGENVNEVFKKLCELIVGKHPDGNENEKGDDKDDDEIIKICAQPEATNDGEKGGCC